MSRVPGMTWVILFAAVLIAGGLFGLYGAGKRAGTVQAHKRALADSVQVSHAAVQHATVRSDSTVLIARRTRESATRTRAAWTATLGTGPIDSLPRPVLVALVQSADAVMRRQDTAIVAAHIAIDTLLAERATRIQADTLEAHQTILGTPDSGYSKADVAKGALVVVGVVSVVKIVLGILHR